LAGPWSGRTCSRWRRGRGPLWRRSRRAGSRRRGRRRTWRSRHRRPGPGGRRSSRRRPGRRRACSGGRRRGRPLSAARPGGRAGRTRGRRGLGNLLRRRRSRPCRRRRRGPCRRSWRRRLGARSHRFRIGEDLLHLVDQLLRVERLRHLAVRSHRDGARRIDRRPAPEQQDRRLLQRGVGADLLAKLVAAEARHVDVGQDQIGLEIARTLERLGAVGDRREREVLLLEDHADRGADGRRVVGEKERLRHATGASGKAFTCTCPALARQAFANLSNRGRRRRRNPSRRGRRPCRRPLPLRPSSSSPSRRSSPRW